MRINADLDRAVSIDTERLDWTQSPMPGVQRKMLDRIGAESGHATSIVRYAPNSYFSEHKHDGGEEFLVLEGIFSDEHGDYKKGSYVRNPIGTRHTPFSKDGCTILVKLNQFDNDDKRQFQLDTDNQSATALSLHQFGKESVSIIKLDAGSHYQLGESGFELLLLEGEISVDNQSFKQSTWIRKPAGSNHTANSAEGARFYLKTGHLPIAGPIVGTVT